MNLSVLKAGASQVRIAGIQQFDLAVCSGWTPPDSEIKVPQILGNEFTGIIDQVDAHVNGLESGHGLEKVVIMID